MATFEWKILELFADCKGVKYSVKATDGTNTVETEGYHEYSEGLVCKPLSEIKESDLINWLEKEHSEDGEIKQNLKNQLLMVFFLLV